MDNNRRKFRSQTSEKYGEMEKQRWEESERRSQEVRRSEKRKNEKQEEAGAQKGRKVAIHCVFFQWFVAPEAKGRLAKAAGAEPWRQMRHEKLHAVVARRTFPSQKAKATSRPAHFWKLRGWESGRRCGAKHISKSKCTKHHMYGPRLTVRFRYVLRGKRKGLWTLPRVSKSWGCRSFNYNQK